MDFIPSQRYIELMDKAMNGEYVDDNELDEAKLEYDKSVLDASARSDAWEENEVAIEKSFQSSVASIISKARNSEKKKLTPLGLPQKKNEEGQSEK